MPLLLAQFSPIIGDCRWYSVSEPRDCWRKEYPRSIQYDTHPVWVQGDEAYMGAIIVFCALIFTIYFRLSYDAGRRRTCRGPYDHAVRLTGRAPVPERAVHLPCY